MDECREGDWDIVKVIITAFMYSCMQRWSEFC